jgi:hypothetical protein
MKNWRRKNSMLRKIIAAKNWRCTKLALQKNKRVLKVLSGYDSFENARARNA